MILGLAGVQKIAEESTQFIDEDNSVGVTPDNGAISKNPVNRFVDERPVLWHKG
jgi:hypothetical protein